MDLSEYSTVFGATVVVLWAVALVPYALKHQKVVLMISSGTMLFVVDAWLSWNSNPFPQNILFSIGFMLFATGGGYLMYLHNKKQDSEVL